MEAHDVLTLNRQIAQASIWPQLFTVKVAGKCGSLAVGQTVARVADVKQQTAAYIVSAHTTNPFAPSGLRTVVCFAEYNQAALSADVLR